MSHCLPRDETSYKQRRLKHDLVFTHSQTCETERKMVNYQSELRQPVRMNLRRAFQLRHMFFKSLLKWKPTLCAKICCRRPIWQPNKVYCSNLREYLRSSSKLCRGLVKLFESSGKEQVKSVRPLMLFSRSALQDLQRVKHIWVNVHLA